MANESKFNCYIFKCATHSLLPSAAAQCKINGGKINSIWLNSGEHVLNDSTFNTHYFILKINNQN